MQVLPSPPIVPSSMEGGNLTTSNMIANPGSPGSRPVTPMPNFNNETAAVLPLPEMPPQRPVNPQAGRYGSAGLQSHGARAPEGDSDSAQWPGGNQGGGNQGGGNPGAGDSGNGGLWTATPSFGPPRWGPGASNS